VEQVIENAEKQEAIAVQPARNYMDLFSLAIREKSAIDVIERLSALQEKEWQRDAEVQFNLAMNSAQAEIVRVAPDLTNPQTHSKYASYPALDRKIRPVYIRHGFSLSFNTADAGVPEMVRVICYVAHKGGHTRTYQCDMPSDGKGARGNDVMTKTHAAGSAMQYGMRYLLKLIFNIAVGVDDDGNAASGGGKVDQGTLHEQTEFLGNASTLVELQKMYKEYYTEAATINDVEAMRALIAAYQAKKKELQ